MTTRKKILRWAGATLVSLAMAATPQTVHAEPRPQLPAASAATASSEDTAPKVAVPKPSKLEKPPADFPKAPEKAPEGKAPTATGAPAALAPAMLGSFDRLDPTPSGFRLRGWAADHNAPSAALAVYAWDDTGQSTWSTANTYRSDVDQVYPGLGSYHGFDFQIPLPSARAGHTVCVNAYAPSSGSIGLGCRTWDTHAFGTNEVFTTEVPSPTGTVMVVQGWAIDPYTSGIATVVVRRDGQIVAQSNTGASRPDVAAYFPAYPIAGYSIGVPRTATNGTHTLCVSALSGGVEQTLNNGCTTYTEDHTTYGSLDKVTRNGENALVEGWALDKDLGTSAMQVEISVDGQVVRTVAANTERTDIVAGFPGYGSAHGFSTTIPARPGQHTVTARAINQGPGADGTWSKIYDSSLGVCPLS
ncbi:hypothetical protein AB0K51_14900 [Kitasatospora sp. NPDC049285]|uniref:hypothetical protein n=1 Tax=Kitasatospora sp. NPDC049285 TaxID=3157096 RepID=UPI00343F6C95